ncbi:MAG TPA: hypothetical protein ENI91_03705 [Sphingomonadales bacterium]|nr:hypothetical protein [Sphingomonadales bacterium]
MEAFGILIQTLFVGMIFATPFLVLAYRNRANKNTGIIFINIISLPIIFAIVLISAYWPEFFGNIRLSSMGFDFYGMTDFERTLGVSPELKAEANSLYWSNMGIGWPLKALIAFVFFVPYPSISLLIFKFLKRRA